MDTYSILRQFADSWWLLVMMLFFIGCVIFAFRPGSRRLHREIANIPLRDEHDDAPRRDEHDAASRRDDDAPARPGKER